MDPAEKRRAQRFPMVLPVVVKPEEPDIEAAVTTKDISSGGVYLEFSAPMDIGSSLEFILTLPAEITQGQAVRVRCIGKVIRVDRAQSNDHSMGVAATIERYEFVRQL